MTKDLSKGIGTKSNTRNEYFNWSSRENFTSFKKTKYKYNLITKKQKKKALFKEAAKGGILTNKTLD